MQSDPVIEDQDFAGALCGAAFVPVGEIAASEIPEDEDYSEEQGHRERDPGSGEYLSALCLLPNFRQ